MIGAMDLSRLPALAPTRTPVAPQPARDVSAAQRAFFRAALGQAADPAPPVPAAAPQATAQPTAQTGEAPSIPRPGSIVDIRV